MDTVLNITYGSFSYVHFTNYNMYPRIITINRYYNYYSQVIPYIYFTRITMTRSLHQEFGSSCSLSGLLEFDSSVYLRI